MENRISKVIFYQNKDTGELLTYEEMKKEARPGDESGPARVIYIYLYIT